MIPGTTPTHTFTLPFEPPSGTEFRIVYAQGSENREEVILEITTDRLKIKGSSISVKLKQEETLRFDRTPVYRYGIYAPSPVLIQVGVETPSRDVLWSDIIETTVERCLRKDGVVFDG